MKIHEKKAVTAILYDFVQNFHELL